jgi:hypothetical protein
MSKYNIGDKVRIVNKRGFGWNSDGLMDKYCGKVLTIMDVEEFEGNEALYTMFECPNWAWNNDDIAELVDASTTEVKPDKSKLEVGMKVRITGDSFDATDSLDGKIGTIVEVHEKHCRVKVEDAPNMFGGWCCYHYNLTPVNEDNTTTTEEATEMKETTTPTTNKVALADTPMEFNIEMATIIAEFTDEILALADKFNTDRRQTMELVAKTVTHTATDDFFWDFILPMQELTNKMREKVGK